MKGFLVLVWIADSDGFSREVVDSLWPTAAICETHIDAAHDKHRNGADSTASAIMAGCVDARTYHRPHR